MEYGIHAHEDTTHKHQGYDDVTNTGDPKGKEVKPLLAIAILTQRVIVRWVYRVDPFVS